MPLLLSYCHFRVKLSLFMCMLIACSGSPPQWSTFSSIFLLVGGCCGVGVGWRVVDVSCTTVDWEDASVLAELVSGGVRRCEEGGGEGGVWMEEMRG